MACGESTPYGVDRSHRRDHPTWQLLIMLGVCVGSLSAAGVAAGVVWPALALRGEPIEMVMAPSGPVPAGEVAAARLFAMEGWFAALGALTGLVAGSVLYWCFRRHGPWTAMALVLGSLIGAGMALTVGTLLANDALVLAWEPSAEIGTRLQAPLSLRAYGVTLVWPVAALVPVLVLAWFWGLHDRARQRDFHR